MMDFTATELQKPSDFPEFTPKKILAEKSVLIEKHGLKEGKFDFLVQTHEKKLVGVEVLTRPTHGKLRQKLAYAKKTDEFIFVLLHNSLGFYRKKEKNGLSSSTRKKFLSPEFASEKIFAWLFDPIEKKFVSKQNFPKEFNVKQKRAHQTFKSLF